MKIYPSIIAANWTMLAKTAHRLEDGGADGLHVDIADGHYLPALTVGPKIVSDLRHVTILPLLVHLTVMNPDQFIETLAIAGATSITLQCEQQHTSDLPRLLDSIRSLGCACGLAIDPETPLDMVLSHLDRIDQILVTSVYPGKSGQTFMPESLERIDYLRNSGFSEIIVEGGVNDHSIQSIKEAGATGVVAASYIFRQPDYGTAIRSLK
jgi:ribulose-phosphate 3-epimerase